MLSGSSVGKDWRGGGARDVFYGDVLLPLGSSLPGKSKLNEIIINKIVGRCRTRPHPWSARYSDWRCQ